MFIQRKLIAGVSLSALVSALEDGDQPKRSILQTVPRPRSSLQLANKGNSTLYRRVACVVFFAIIPLTAAAGEPDDYVFLPGVTYGEREIEFRLGTFKKAEEGRESAATVGFGYGVTQRWFTEFYFKFQHTDDRGTHYDAWEWENKFQLTETGQYPVDAGFIVEIEKPNDLAGGYQVRLGPLLQTEVGKVQLNTNFLLTQIFGSHSSQRAEYGYQWQAKYRWQPKFEFGFQGFGDVGSWNHWDAIEEPSPQHRMGPAIFGKFALGGRQAIRYNAAFLFLKSNNAPSQNFRAQVEYEF
ncbi:MAG: hypothetical protein ACREUJ_06220 [Burkholderiales bacterium]